MFGVIVGGLLVLVVAQTWLKEMLQVRLREWLTHDLLDRWLAPKRAYLLAHAGEIGVNPDQRVHEDTRHLIDLSTDLAVGLLQASLLLISFIGVLWVLSARSCSWSAIAASPRSGLHGLVRARLRDRRLLARLAGRSAADPAQRHALRPRGGSALPLVRVSECAEGIALHGGETDERRILDGTVDHVVTVMRELAGGLPGSPG